jgi:hypothetical protein
MSFSSVHKLRGNAFFRQIVTRLVAVRAGNRSCLIDPPSASQMIVCEIISVTPRLGRSEMAHHDSLVACQGECRSCTSRRAQASRHLHVKCGSVSATLQVDFATLYFAAPQFEHNMWAGSQYILTTNIFCKICSSCTDRSIWMIAAMLGGEHIVGHLPVIVEFC